MKDMILRFWKKWFGEKAEQVVNNASEGVVASSSVKKENSEPSTMLQRLEKFLMSKYDFRFNVLTEQTEYRRKGERTFRQVEQRALNTLCIDARSQGVNCWDKDVARLLLSEKQLRCLICYFLFFFTLITSGMLNCSPKRSSSS